jgi:hypothetical protein
MPPTAGAHPPEDDARRPLQTKQSDDARRQDRQKQQTEGEGGGGTHELNATRGSTMQDRVAV